MQRAEKVRKDDAGGSSGSKLGEEDVKFNACVVQRRLSATDCHRVHSPVTGRLKRVVWLGKTLYGCTAPAVHSAVDVYGDSERAVLEFDTPTFGTVMFCIIGATEVGSINRNIKEGDHVTNGQNVSYYQYGGSMVTTLLHHKSIILDEDLRRNSANNKETRVKMGQSLGSARNSKH
ncbi:probable phosphatidylserine decarboxylase proenzyme 2 [Coccomyxa sp. Obi]|nr:probable phosphatidylserine decarboxylase proenzyme 2 [Coccomyxa sp. Obi]